MKTKIYVVTIASYTENDNYLHTEQKTFTNKLLAQDYFEEQSDKARRECEWAEYWDADQDDRTEAYQYPVSEKKERDTYRVESEAYCGYHVCIKFEEQEIDVPFATDRRKYGMTLREIRDEIAAFTGDKKGEAMRKAKIFAHHISIAHVCRIRLSFGKYSRTENGETVYYGENRDTLQIQWTDLDGDSDTFSIIE